MSKESNHQFIHQLMSSLKRIQDHINEPEVIQSILDTIMPRDEELASILEPEDEDLLETDNWKQSPYYSKAAQQIDGWHSDADVRNLARQLRDADSDDGPNEDSKNFAADVQAKLNKAATEEKINMASGAEPTPTPRPLSSDDEWSDDYDKKHEGFEQQAEGLDNLLAGLKDGPKDERW